MASFPQSNVNIARVITGIVVRGAFLARRRIAEGQVERPHQVAAPIKWVTVPPGRHHPGMMGEIIPEWWATSSGISNFG
jgi:hypothetical protein